MSMGFPVPSKLASEDPLVRVAQTVHFPRKIADIAHIQRHIVGDLKLRSEAGLLDITGPFVWILSANLKLRQIKRAGSKLTDRKSVLQLKDRRCTSQSLGQTVGDNGRRIQSQNALRTYADPLLIKNAVPATKYDSLPWVIAKAQPGREVVLIGMNQ